MIDLEFDAPDQARAFLTALRELWGRVEVMRDPKARVAEVIESAELSVAVGAA